MNAIVSKLSPSITNMIRLDHTHVMASFHQYDMDAGAQTRQALVKTICLSLEMHAQMEEEIFYPAMRALGMDTATLDKSIPEHDEMKRLVGRLRQMDPDDAEYSDTLMELMRDVMHHVADEETILLRDAERSMEPERLSELGAQWTKRRLQLAAPHAGEIAWNTMRGLPTTSVLVAAGAVLAGTYLMKRSGRRHTM